MHKWLVWLRPLLLVAAAAAAGIVANVALLGVASGSSADAVGHFKPRLRPAAAATIVPATRRVTETTPSSKPSTKPQPTTTAYSTGTPMVAYDDHGSGSIEATEPPDD